MSLVANDLACKGLVTTKEALESGDDSKSDPDGITMKSFKEDEAEWFAENGADIKDGESEEDLIHNARNYYDWKKLDSGFCM